ncbi:hypothetical protein QAD02_009531 [Eretmocerus hayati]|uniref:Uncharacterized protein n=1 Tax=Eretmocerus hayati TaxID=131215 RepID=A0ACC2N9Q6_9HYME|nr:hypothetical protein QAD02_009531 [Eretmocerus hayati]
MNKYRTERPLIVPNGAEMLSTVEGFRGTSDTLSNSQNQQIFAMGDDISLQGSYYGTDGDFSGQQYNSMQEYNRGQIVADTHQETGYSGSWSTQDCNVIYYQNQEGLQEVSQEATGSGYDTSMDRMSCLETWDWVCDSAMALLEQNHGTMLDTNFLDEEYMGFTWESQTSTDRGSMNAETLGQLPRIALEPGDQILCEDENEVSNELQRVIEEIVISFHGRHK